ncbi:MAG TPA: PEP-utilizing enzyme, partial [Nocardioidaceae bacterium]
GGGRGVGPVCQGTMHRPPSPGDVLVVRALEPGLAGWLPGLAGLVAETGASLSHLAILAREYGVPTVVAVHDALNRFPSGVRVLVDGATGEVRVVGGDEGP